MEAPKAPPPEALTIVAPQHQPQQQDETAAAAATTTPTKQQPKSNKNNNKNNNNKARSKSPKNRTPRSRSPKPRSPRPAADMTLVVHRVDLFDSGHSEDDRQHSHQGPVCNQAQRVNLEVGPIRYESPKTDASATTTAAAAAEFFAMDGGDEEAKPIKTGGSITACRIPPQTHPSPVTHRILPFPVVDNTTPNPLGASIEKYWQQRRRLFSRFDEGIELDEQGWFSVTPEQIADHVAQRFVELVQMAVSTQQQQPPPVVMLDAFCGCGGNAIAFAKQPNTIVYAVDTDRSKLRKAAHNAAIYQIPPHQLVFVECNVIFILEYCFSNGEFVLDQPIATPEQAMALMQSMPPPVPCEVYDGYSIGGIDVLPRRIDAVFMDPPWGGVDYEVLGKHGYDLERNMKIQRPTSGGGATAKPATPSAAGGSAGGNGNLGDDFFDSFQPQPRSKKERISQFNSGMNEDNCVNGAELLALAAAATATRWVLYDVPRNTNHRSIGQAALAAGYRGNCKVEEHYLNCRLKTVTAYFGSDWRNLLQVNGTLGVNPLN